MHSAFRSVAVVAVVGLAATLGGQGARADVAPTQPVALAVLNLDYIDTSGEPTDQTAVHQQRAADFVSALQRDLAANGQYRVVPMSCGSAPCEPVMNPAVLQKAARAAGARFVVLGGVHKMSTLVQWAKIQVADEEQGRIVFDRLLTFRGDTDEAWQKAESFVARDVLNLAPTFGKQGDAIAPVKLAVFDFELEDFSGGAELIPESDQDREQLRLATETVRRLLVKSGRYSLVDVSGADAADAKRPRPAQMRRLRRRDRSQTWRGSIPCWHSDPHQPHRLRRHLQASRHANRRGPRRRADRPSHRRELFVEPRRRVADQEPAAGETGPAIGVRPRGLATRG